MMIFLVILSFVTICLGFALWVMWATDPNRQ